MPKLTGHQRAQLTIAWLKRKDVEPFEEFVKRVCKLKGIEYVPPKPREERK